jgi:outer membrane lipoprotein-sorting protein
MSFLRTVPTRRLLAIIAGLVAAIAGGTAIAVAAAGKGPVPRRTTLARAIHGALAAPQVKGITARITFTNHLIDSSDIQGVDPLLTGATGRLWLSPDQHRLRLELQSDNGEDAQAVVNDGAFWVYDPASNTVYEGKLPSEGHPADRQHEHESAPSLAEIQRNLNRVMKHVLVSGAIPDDVAGRPAYTVRVSPKHDGGLLGAAELGWDALRGVPLRLAVYARGETTPVIELKATDISYGSVPASAFEVSPPPGAKVVRVSTPSGARGQSAKHALRNKHREVSGVAAVARRVPFKLVAPRSLVGLPRQSVTLLDWQGTPAALVTYGQNLGGIAVIEHRSQGADQKQGADQRQGAGQSQGGDRHGLNLPTVSINGATGDELDTPLGTFVRFTRGGVEYVVAGSVPPAAADAAARGL